MDFARQQRNPTKHIAGLGFVVLLHIAIVYALLNGLARKVVEVIQRPIETKIIEEVKPPPPDIPPPPPPPKMVAPPPPFIPPPEVQIQQPPPPQQTITAVTNTPPPEPVPFVPAPPAPVEAPPAPAAPAATVGVACPNVKTIAGQITYPGKAVREGIKSGQVLIQFMIGPNGEIKNPTVVRSSNRLFNTPAIEGVGLLKCIGQGRDVPIQWEIAFKLNE